MVYSWSPAKVWVTYGRWSKLTEEPIIKPDGIEDWPTYNVKKRVLLPDGTQEWYDDENCLHRWRVQKNGTSMGSFEGVAFPRIPRISRGKEKMAWSLKIKELVVATLIFALLGVLFFTMVLAHCDSDKHCWHSELTEEVGRFWAASVFFVLGFLFALSFVDRGNKKK